MRKLLGLCAVLTLTALPMQLSAADKVINRAKPDLSLKLEVENAIGKGLTWFSGKQQAGGNWAQPEYPAVTSLILTAFQGDPSNFYKIRYASNIKNGYDYLLKCAKPDGGIYVKDLKNYNTAIGMMALFTANNPAYEPLLKKGRQYLIRQQDDFGEKGMGDHPLDGGIGYGGTYKNSDINNTTTALESLYYTRYLQSDVADDPDTKDLNWKAVSQFISRTQHLPGSNDQKWVSNDPANRGGFVYFPENSKSPDMKLDDGKTVLHAYGSASYLGLLSLIYAQVDKNDARVKAVIDWHGRNFSLDENPGMEQQGLFYYYYAMAKALSIASVDTMPGKDGKRVNWRQELAKRLIDMQDSDGSWTNKKSGRFWEKDPNLVTAYAVITLEILHRGL